MASKIHNGNTHSYANFIYTLKLLAKSLLHARPSRNCGFHGKIFLSSRRDFNFMLPEARS